MQNFDYLHYVRIKWTATVTVQLNHNCLLTVDWTVLSRCNSWFKNCCQRYAALLGMFCTGTSCLWPSRASVPCELPSLSVLTCVVHYVTVACVICNRWDVVSCGWEVSSSRRRRHSLVAHICCQWSATTTAVWPCGWLCAVSAGALITVV